MTRSLSTPQSRVDSVRGACILTKLQQHGQIFVDIDIKYSCDERQTMRPCLQVSYNRLAVAGHRAIFKSRAGITMSRTVQT